MQLRAEPSRTSPRPVTLSSSSLENPVEDGEITSMHREQQPVEPLYERCGLSQLASVCKRRLLEQQHRQVVEGCVFSRRFDPLQQRMLDIDFQRRLGRGRLLPGG